jgi:hypothetical protein
MGGTRFAKTSSRRCLIAGELLRHLKAAIRKFITSGGGGP